MAGWGFVRGQAGDPIDCFLTLFIFLELSELPADTEDLPDIREFKVMVQFASGPDLANFQTAMGFIDGLVLRGENRPDEGLRCPALGFVDYL